MVTLEYSIHLKVRLTTPLTGKAWRGAIQVCFFFLWSTAVECKGDVTRDDWQRRFLAQHSVATVPDSKATLKLIVN